MDSLAFGATVCSGCLNTIAERKAFYLSGLTHVEEMNSPLLCHQRIQFQQDNG